MSEEDLPLLSHYSDNPTSRPKMQESSIRILSLNCWGLKFVAKDRVERVKAIAAKLADSSYDVVALQELWVSSDYQFVRAAVSTKLPHAKYFYSGALGAGLCIFSRFPFTSASIQPYSLNGHPVEVSDWMVGKAAASILIKHPVLGEVEIYNTHLFAKESVQAHRLINAWEFAKCVRNSATLGRYVIAAGDLNGIPKTLPMTIIRDHAGLTDSWTESHSQPSPQSISTLSPSQVIDTNGVTADSPLNSYSAGKPLDSTARAEHGKRLDYILYRYPIEFNPSKMPHLICSRSQVVFTDKVPGHDFSYSDHFGLEAILEIVPPTESGEYDKTPSSLHTQTSLSEESISAFLRALTTFYKTSQTQSKVELTTFVLCVSFILVECVGSAWIPLSWITPLLILLTTASAWWGTTMLYSGFIYGNWERRALTNVIEELELVQRLRS